MSTRRIQVFHGFMGVMAFIAYTLPLMLLISTSRGREETDDAWHAGTS